MLAAHTPLGIQGRKASRGMDMRKIAVKCAGLEPTHSTTVETTKKGPLPLVHHGACFALMG